VGVDHGRLDVLVAEIEVDGADAEPNAHGPGGAERAVLPDRGTARRCP
jgi:hypothetical protein